MSKFDKALFVKSSGYVTYGPTGRFVARFKYMKGSASSFITFLVRNFTVEEYFARREAGETPLAIVESRGYVLPHIKKILKERGYPLTPAGMSAMIRNDAAR